MSIVHHPGKDKKRNGERQGQRTADRTKKKQQSGHPCCVLEALSSLYRSHFTTRAEVEQLVAEYVDFYNFERISLKNGLTPVEIRSKTALFYEILR